MSHRTLHFVCAALGLAGGLSEYDIARAQDATAGAGGGEVPTAPAESPEAEASEAPPDDEGDGSDDEACVGGIEGEVRDRVTGETLIEAPVLVVGTTRRVMTDELGRFRLRLRPGRHSLRTYYDLYEPARLNDIVVGRGRCTEVALELESSATEGEEVVIEVRADTGSAASQLRARRESATVQDGISREEMRRSPDSDAGQAVRRVVGASVVNGQYLFVRGLGGRYTQALLNGAYLPASDPDQPGVQLDIFPSAVLDGLQVMKTFTADLPGDAAGGTLLLSTRDYPERFQLQIGLSLGANTETTLGTSPVGQGGGLDFLGFDDGSRALPTSVPRDRLLPAAATATPELIDASRGFRPSWGISDALALPNGRLSLTMGDRLDVGGHRLGYFVSAGYSLSTQALRNERVNFVSVDTSGEEPVVSPGPEVRRDSTTTTAQLSALGTVGLEVSPRDEVALTVLLSQTGESYTGRFFGRDVELDQTTRQTRVRWVERGLAFGQLHGEHRGLPFGMTATWSFNGSISTRNEPDTRDLVYGANEGSETFFYRDIAGSGTRLFMDLTSRELSANGELNIPIDTSSVRIGGLVRTNERDFRFRRFRSRLLDGFDSNALVLPPEQLFAPSQVGTNVVTTEFTDGNDGYGASQSLAAAFVAGDVRLFEPVRLVAGLRAESFRQTVDPRLPLPQQSSISDAVFRTDLDLLGNAAVIVTLPENMMLRASYGTTVARPQIRELSPFTYPDFIRLRTVTGNPELRRSRIDNFDLRWELFPGANEVIAVSGFVKRFDDPIEMVAFTNSTFSYRNADSALVAGGEVEARIGLGRLTSALSNFDVGANFTLVHSEVQLTEEQRASSTNAQRPLAGQSPYVVNLSLGVSVPETELEVRVYYNVFGPRLIEVGSQGLPDVYQQPLHGLDVTATWGFDPNFELRAAVENLFFDDYLLTQGDVTVQQYNGGLTASLTLVYRPFR